MSTESIILIVTVVATGATVILAIAAMATLFHRSLSGMKEDLQRQIDRTHKRVDELSVRVDQLSVRVAQLSDKVSQIIAILGTAGVDVKESRVSYKGGEGTAPAAKPKDDPPGGSKKSG